MARRIPEARSLGRARLKGYAFTCNKVGRDGTAKANVEATRAEDVWGVLYELTATNLDTLDRYEGGYRRVRVSAELPSGDSVACDLYVSTQTSTKLVPSRAYRDRMVRGAREHDLPESCCRALEALVVAD